MTKVATCQACPKELPHLNDSFAYNQRTLGNILLAWLTLTHVNIQFKHLKFWFQNFRLYLVLSQNLKGKILLNKITSASYNIAILYLVPNRVVSHTDSSLSLIFHFTIHTSNNDHNKGSPMGTFYFHVIGKCSQDRVNTRYKTNNSALMK